ncbi:type II secretion system minor pseudopilin GspI [Pseudomonas sp. D2-3]
MKRESGFTLLEVLVALAIFALVAASVLTSTSRSLQNASRLEEKTLAMWVADNRLAELQLSKSLVADGREQGEVEFAGRRWRWQSEIQATSDTDLRRVTLWVAPTENERMAGDLSERAVVNLRGFLGVAK